MKARDIISPRSLAAESIPQSNIAAEAAVVDVLPRLLDTVDHRLGVTDGKELIGIIDAESLLAGLNSMIAPRDDSSMIIMEMTPSAYSASHIAQAVEDADVHLVDLWTSPSDADMLRVTLRVRTEDPSSVVGSLERYGYDVVETTAHENRNVSTAIERLLSLNAMLNV